MKKEDNNIAIKLKQTVLVIGILIGFCTMTVNDQWAIQIPQTMEESAPDEEGANSTQQVKAIDAITYSSQINVNHQSILVEELPEDEIEQEKNLEKNFVISYSSKALKILFRSIISSNAP